MEFSGYDTRLHPARVAALRNGVRRFLRDPGPLDSGGEWCGWRPMTPDELPIIDRSPRFENAFVATGHGMMGVSMAPATVAAGPRARHGRGALPGSAPVLGRAVSVAPLHRRLDVRLDVSPRSPRRA